MDIENGGRLAGDEVGGDLSSQMGPKRRNWWVAPQLTGECPSALVELAFCTAEKASTIILADLEAQTTSSSVQSSTPFIGPAAALARRKAHNNNAFSSKPKGQSQLPPSDSPQTCTKSGLLNGGHNVLVLGTLLQAAGEVDLNAI